jgi:LysM repeat protein
VTKKINQRLNNKNSTAPDIMNEQSPLVPQGSLVEQKNKGRARVKIAVFFVLAVHGIGLLALLMQGCRQEPSSTASSDQATTPPPPEVVATNPPTPSNYQAVATTPAPPTPEVTSQATPPVTQAATDYKVAPRDNFTTIGRKFGVTAREIAAANPGVDSSKLQVGQTLHIPAPTKAVTTTAPQGAAQPMVSDTASGEQLYSVVSGDNLTRIAAKYTTTVRALRSVNGLSTDRLTVGQKLKIPVKAATSNSNAGGAVEQVATNPMNVPGTSTTVR